MKKHGDWKGAMALALLAALGACGKVESSPPTAAAVCGLASLADVQAVIGGRIEKVDVIDEASLPTLDCIYADAGDLYNSLSLRFVTTGRLVATDSQWTTAAAYFAEWGRNGTAVADLGDGAAWIQMPAGLLVLAGDTAFHLGVGKGDLQSPEVRARLEAFARQVAARM